MYIWKQSFLKKLGNSLCLILLILNNSTVADEKMKEFSSLFSPPLSAVQTKAFFLLGVDDSEKLEATFNRMSEQNYTDSNDINEDILLEFLFDESEGKKIGLSAKEHKEQRLNSSKVFTLTWENGTKYVGEVKNGFPHGTGTYTWPDGSEYVGDWENNKMHGKGTMTNNDVLDGNNYRSKYIGEWKDNLKNGIGTQTYRLGHKYAGAWKDDKRHGRGTFTWAFGTSISYEGDWKDDKRDGTGTYIWRSGDKYEGGWKDNKKHGEGILTFANGKVQEDTWINDYTQEFIDGRNNKRFKPYVACMGVPAERQINIMMNLFQNRNRPAAVTYMLDNGCTNSWSRPIRGRDLEEFSRNGKFIGVKTKVHMTGVGKIYAIILADEWDSN
jgi:hypothetical protein